MIPYPDDGEVLSLDELRKLIGQDVLVTGKYFTVEGFLVDNENKIWLIGDPVKDK